MKQQWKESYTFYLGKQKVAKDSFHSFLNEND